MAAKIISVDPLKRDDPYYRYKMPEILVKVESSGNGVKSVFPNIRDVCERLARPEEIMIKFFGYELGTQSTIVKKDDKFILMGSHTPERMQEKVDAFVTKFVLCSHCRNPETDVGVDGKNVILTCRGCGKRTPLNAAERALTLFHTFYSSKKVPAMNKGMTSAAAAADADAAAAAAAVAQAASSPTTMVEMSAEPAAAANEENPIEVLAEVLDEMPNEREVQERKIYELRAQHNLEEALVVRLVFRAAIDAAMKKEGKPFIGALQRHIELIKRFADKPELQKVLIKEAVFHCASNGVTDKFPMVIKALVEMNALKEAEFLQWFETEEKAKKKAQVAPELVAEMKLKSQPLVAWMNQGEPTA